MFGTFNPKLPTAKRPRHFKPNIIANYLIKPSDDLIFVDASSGSKTINLLPASSLIGYSFVITKIDSSINAVIITAASGENIGSSSTNTLDEQWMSVTIASNGTSWIVI